MNLPPEWLHHCELETTPRSCFYFRRALGGAKLPERAVQEDAASPMIRGSPILPGNDCLVLDIYFALYSGNVVPFLSWPLGESRFECRPDSLTVEFEHNYRVCERQNLEDVT